MRDAMLVTIVGAALAASAFAQQSEVGKREETSRIASPKV